MTGYHSDEYIRFLKSIRPDNVGEYTKLMQRCETKSCVHIVILSSPVVNVGEDCPVFDGMYEFCQLSAGGSIGRFLPLPPPLGIFPLMTYLSLSSSSPSSPSPSFSSFSSYFSCCGKD